MADTENTVTTPHAQEDSFLPDPSGWTSEDAEQYGIKRMISAYLGVQPSDIEYILEEKDLDQFIFTSKHSGSTVFYLFSSGDSEAYEVVKPSTQKELWDVLQYDNWRGRLVLKEVEYESE